MNLKPIKTKHDYQTALKRVRNLMHATPGTDEGDELEVLSILVDNYERHHFPTPLISPVEAIKFRMEQMGLSQDDMVPYFGSKSHVTAVFSGKRELSMLMIRRLHNHLNIPLEFLVQINKIDIAEDVHFALLQTLSHVKGNRVPGIRVQVVRAEKSRLKKPASKNSHEL